MSSLADARQPRNRIEGLWPKLRPRMLPPTQRRNQAYLNPLIERPAAWTGLAIDLGGSLEQRFRPEDFGCKICAPPRASSAAATKGSSLAMDSKQQKRFVRSNG
jgi:hypothetical protein